MLQDRRIRVKETIFPSILAIFVPIVGVMHFRHDAYNEQAIQSNASPFFIIRNNLSINNI